MQGYKMIQSLESAVEYSDEKSILSTLKQIYEQDRFIYELIEITDRYFHSDITWVDKKEQFEQILRYIKARYVQDQTSKSFMETFAECLKWYIYDTEYYLNKLEKNEQNTVYMAEYTEENDKEKTSDKQLVKVPGFFKSYEEAVEACKIFRKLYAWKKTTPYIITKYYYVNEISPYDDKLVYCVLNDEMNASHISGVCIEDENSDLCSAGKFFEDLHEVINSKEMRKN